MTAIEIARQLAELGETEGAIKAYGVVLHQAQSPEEELEGALYILQNGGDYKVSYSTFIGLYRRGQFREDCLSILTQAFYEPNVKRLKSRYEHNCKRLKSYPYLFRKDFPRFEDLAIRFYPFDDNGYVPFFPEEGRFGDYVNARAEVISRNFFHDLENPILAKDVFSQYELEYLNDNVRPSEWVARENHIYLHYSDWGQFCSWLQVLNLRPLTEGKKVVFLMEDELELYPIDFKERFGIDYGKYPLKPLEVAEVTRLIWHTQLSSHNGGDFFNEIFDGHPNLLFMASMMMDNVEKIILDSREMLKETENNLVRLEKSTVVQARSLGTDKDIFVALYMDQSNATRSLDFAARIVPAVFFQPHFPNLTYDFSVDGQGNTVLRSDEYDKIANSPIFRGFKYIKTFTPLRRPTTSHGATVKFTREMVADPPKDKSEGDTRYYVPDALLMRVMNRSFMVDSQDRLYKDSVLVRFEDGKLNPKATFTALAAFLDLPYTESMTYCSDGEVRDPESLKGNARGFDPAAVYRTYDDYVNDAERYFIEYFLRDVYQYYGYSFKWYDGKLLENDQVMQLLNQFTTMDHYIREGWMEGIVPGLRVTLGGEEISPEVAAQARERICDQQMEVIAENRKHVVAYLLRGLNFINKNGQPLHMMPKLKLDEALLEQPLYH